MKRFAIALFAATAMLAGAVQATVDIVTRTIGLRGGAVSGAVQLVARLVHGVLGRVQRLGGRGLDIVGRVLRRRLDVRTDRVGGLLGLLLAVFAARGQRDRGGTGQGEDKGLLHGKHSRFEHMIGVPTQINRFGSELFFMNSLR